MVTAAAVKDEEQATRFAKDQLKSIIERIERLEEEKKTISDDIRDVYAESEGQRLRREGAARRDPPAQAGSQRAPGTGDDPGDLHAGAGDDLTSSSRGGAQAPSRGMKYGDLLGLMVRDARSGVPLTMRN